jgi:hypothetical protein
MGIWQQVEACRIELLLYKSATQEKLNRVTAAGNIIRIELYAINEK